MKGEQSLLRPTTASQAADFPWRREDARSARGTAGAAGGGALAARAGKGTRAGDASASEGNSRFPCPLFQHTRRPNSLRGSPASHVRPGVPPRGEAPNHGTGGRRGRPAGPRRLLPPEGLHYRWPVRLSQLQS